MFISCPVRDGDLDKFFAHENQPKPPSLCELGENLYNKAEMANLLEEHITPLTQTPKCETTIIDGAAAMHFVTPGNCKTIDEYAETFSQYVVKKFELSARVDVVFDTYLDEGLKSCTCLKCGGGPRCRVTGNMPIPSNWKAFLSVNQNKQELFSYLSFFWSRKPEYPLERTCMLPKKKRFCVMK